MVKALILQAQHNLSDARMEFMIRDRLSWMRFLGFDLGAHQKTRFGLFIRTIGLARAEAILTLANIACNFDP